MTSAGEALAIGLQDGHVRVVIERVTPAVLDGGFPIKRVRGDSIDVEADCVADGPEVVACALRRRQRGAAGWRPTPMRPLGNHRWRAAFKVDAVSSREYTVRARVDPCISWGPANAIASAWAAIVARRT